MALLATVITLAAPGLHAPCDRDCQAAKQPPCQTTCTNAERRDMSRESDTLRHRLADLRRWQHWAQTIGPFRDWLGRLRACESRGNWRITNSLGYQGGYQFGSWAWHAVGGTGQPRDARPASQRPERRARLAQRH